MWVFMVQNCDNNEWMYCSHDVILPREKISDNALLEHFFFRDYKKAKNLMFQMILNRRDEFKAVKIVKISHYSPFPEQSVVVYQDLNSTSY